MATTNIEITTDVAGQIEVNPRLVRLNTTDNYATITAAGYLNNYSGLVPSLKATDMIMCNYGTSNEKAIFNPQIDADGIITLIPATLEITSAVTANHFAIYADAFGNLTQDVTPAINAGDIQAGVSGNDGSFISCPPTAAKGTFVFKAADSVGNTTTTLTHASMGQQTTFTLPDPAAATANVGLTTGAFTVNNLVKSSTTNGVFVDANYRIYSGPLAWGGGGTSNVFAVTGLTINSVGACQITSQAGTATILSALPGANTLTVTFSADPGAMTLSYIYTSLSSLG